MLSDNKKNMFFSGNILKKIVIIIVGSVIAAYGITLALYAGFGGATLAVLWQGISKTFHISIGMASLVVAVGMILFDTYWNGVISDCLQFMCRFICNMPRI